MIVGLYISNQQEKRGSPRLSLGNWDVQKKTTTLYQGFGLESRRGHGLALLPLACQAEGRQDSGAVSTSRCCAAVGLTLHCWQHEGERHSNTSIATGFVVCSQWLSTGPKQTLPNCRCVKILLLLRELGIICCLSPSETVPLFCPGGGGVPWEG